MRNISAVRQSVCCILLTSALVLSGNGQSIAADSNSITSDNQPAQLPPIKIGFIAPLSGRISAEGGREMVNGMKLFLEQSNYKFAGRPVKLIVEDDEDSVPAAVGKIRKLVEEDKVDVLDGLLLTSLGYEVAPFVDRYQVPMIFPVAASDDITKRHRHKWIIRTSWSSSQAGHPFGEWVYKTLGYKKVAILGLDFPLGWEVSGGFQRTFEEAGGKVIQKIWLPMALANFSSYIERIDKDADAVFVVSSVGQADEMAKELHQLRPNLPVIGCGSGYEDRTIHSVGLPTLGAVTVFHYATTLDTAANRAFVKAFTQKFGHPPDTLAEDCYVSAMWIEKAAQAVHGRMGDKEQFLAALKHVRLSDAPRGPIELDAYGNPVENFYVRRVEMVDGRPENKVIHTFNKVSQFWHDKPKDFLKLPPYSKDYPPCRYCK